MEVVVWLGVEAVDVREQLGTMLALFVYTVDEEVLRPACGLGMQSAETLLSQFNGEKVTEDSPVAAWSSAQFKFRYLLELSKPHLPNMNKHSNVHFGACSQ